MNTAIGLEPFSNYGVVNTIVFGGSNQASKSYFGWPICEIVITSNINDDCKVDFLDYELIDSHRLEGNQQIVGGLVGNSNRKFLAQERLFR